MAASAPPLAIIKVPLDPTLINGLVRVPPPPIVVVPPLMPTDAADTALLKARDPAPVLLIPAATLIALPPNV